MSSNNFLKDLRELEDLYPEILVELVEALEYGRDNFDCNHVNQLTITNFILSFNICGGGFSPSSCTIDQRYEGSIEHPTGSIWEFSIRNGNVVGTEIEYFEKVQNTLNPSEISINIPKQYKFKWNIEKYGEEFRQHLLDDLQAMSPKETNELLLGVWAIEDTTWTTRKTTKQLIEAPKNAIFVWYANDHAPYIKDLRNKLGRHDIKIKPRSWLLGRKVPWRAIGEKCLDVVIDHALEVRKNEKSLYDAFIQYRKSWEEKLSRENVVKKEIEQSTIELKQENDMKIENVTLVDGVQTKDLSEDMLIQAIDNELKKADRLQKLINSSPTKSSALRIKVKEHLENVEKLTNILDNK